MQEEMGAAVTKLISEEGGKYLKRQVVTYIDTGVPYTLMPRYVHHCALVELSGMIFGRDQELMVLGSSRMSIQTLKNIIFVLGQLWYSVEPSFGPVSAL